MRESGTRVPLPINDRPLNEVEVALEALAGESRTLPGAARSAGFKGMLVFKARALWWGTANVAATDMLARCGFLSAPVESCNDVRGRSCGDRTGSACDVPIC